MRSAICGPARSFRKFMAVGRRLPVPRRVEKLLADCGDNCVLRPLPAFTGMTVAGLNFSTGFRSTTQPEPMHAGARPIASAADARQAAGASAARVSSARLSNATACSRPNRRELVQKLVEGVAAFQVV